MKFTYERIEVKELRPVPTDVATNDQINSLNSAIENVKTEIAKQIIETVGAEQLVNESLQVAINQTSEALIAAQDNLYSALKSEVNNVSKIAADADAKINSAILSTKVELGGVAAQANIATSEVRNLAGATESTFTSIQDAVDNLAEVTRKLVGAHA